MLNPNVNPKLEAIIGGRNYSGTTFFHHPLPRLGPIETSISVNQPIRCFEDEKVSISELEVTSYFFALDHNDTVREPGVFVKTSKRGAVLVAAVAGTDAYHGFRLAGHMERTVEYFPPDYKVWPLRVRLEVMPASPA